MPILSNAELSPKVQRSSAPTQRPSAAKPKGKHGGARPGAGAPRGNLNALKHGLRSKQFAAIGALLAEDPKIREALLIIARRKNMKQRKAQTVAAALLAAVIDRAHDIAGGRLNVDLPVHDWRIIKQAAAEFTPPRHPAPPAKRKPPAQQPRSPYRRPQSTKAQIRKTP